MKRIRLNTSLKEILLIFIISFVSALFAWYLQRILSGLTTLYFSYDLNIKAVLHLDGITFFTPASSQAWTRDAIVTINLAAPIMNLFFGLIIMAVFIFSHRKSRSMAFFLIWLMIYSFTGIFGSFVENNIARTGLYTVSKLMDIGVVFQIIFVVLALYFLYVMGLSIGKLVMLIIPEKFKYEDKINIIFFLTAFVFPWLLVLAVTLKGLSTSTMFTYLIGLIVLLPFNWMQAPEKKGLHLKTLPGFLRIDLLSLLVYLFGILLLHQMLGLGMSL
ncbi:MAG: hypothetical protein IEMM0006_0726 [bacterium]|nr:MAG: hypothetical protein IEMM0006_0726 [bacterium]